VAERGIIALRSGGHARLRYFPIPGMTKFAIFRDSDLATDCDECGGRVDVVIGGACVRCRRILCFRHLHGSFARRLAADLWSEPICVRCRCDG
jgi:hypothetical protein